MFTGYGNIPSAPEAVDQGDWNYRSKLADTDQILMALHRTPGAVGDSEPSPPSLERLEREYVHRVPADNEGKISLTAAVLGLSCRSLQRKLQKSPPP